jgi:adenylate cyclase
VLALVAWSPAPVQALREALFDTYQRLYPRERKSAPVTIVEIDEATLTERGQWPWPRTLVAELVAKIAKESPAAIGLDLLFPEPDRFSPAEVARSIPDLPDDVAKRLQALPSNDARLAEAIRGRKVVLALAGLEAPDPRFVQPPGAATVRLSTAAETQLRAFPGYLASIPEIDRAAAGRGLISVDSAERIVRRVPMLAKVAGSTVPALSLELWRIASGASELTVREAGAGVLEMSFADAKIPVQRDGSMWLRYSRHEPARFVSASDILGGRASTAQLHSRIVLIGVTGLGLLDYKATPLGEQVPGVELHAQLIEQIFDGAYLVRPAWAPWLEFALLALGTGLLIALVPGVRVHYSVIALIALVLITVLAAVGAFAAGVLLDAAWPTLGFAAAFSVLLATTLSEADRQRRELREAAARSAGELEAARRIQMGLLPDPVALFGAERGFALRALVQPARTVGGDFYDCFKLDEARACLRRCSWRFARPRSRPQ